MVKDKDGGDSSSGSHFSSHFTRYVFSTMLPIVCSYPCEPSNLMSSLAAWAKEDSSDFRSHSYSGKPPTFLFLALYEQGKLPEI